MANRVKAVLVEAFKRLTKRERANLLYHHDRGTKILCGDYAHMFAARGAG